ncbi:MAG: efflux RND transporter permease subunit, partial [Candidatus Gracilibacteria bacterium]|nr:efflux RND transporter permease subunit [Candidatus Gracilibacteria bacterium]
MENESQKLEKFKDSFWTFLINKRPVTWVLIIAITIMGLFSVMTMPREIQPEINIPMGAVSTFLPGASPLDVESLITEPLEKEISTISGIKSLSSESGFSVSLIVIEFETSKNIDKAIQELKDSVDKIKSELPEDASTPNAMRIEANEFAIITYSIMGDKSMTELSKIAENIKPYLEKISGVSKATIVGEQIEEIHVTIDQSKIEQYGLDLQTISNLIKYSNLNLPLGIVTLDQLNYSIRIDNRYSTLEDIQSLPLFVAGPTQTPILLKDIAKVKKGYPEQNIITKLSLLGQKSLPAVSLQIHKKEGGNILKIVETTKAEITKLQEKNIIPKDVQIAVSNDNSMFIKEDLGVLTENGIATIFLVIIIMFLALGLRAGIIAGIMVPLTFFITFSIMEFMDLTINSLSLFSMVIALGIMVDTSIVIMQGIHDNIKKGLNSKDAAIKTVYTYRWPLIAGTLTTVFAFFPMLLVSGIIGEFLRTLPIVISATLFGSLFLGLTITPSIASRIIDSQKERAKTNFMEPIFEKIENKLEILNKALLNKKIARISLIIIILSLFFTSLALPITGLLKTEMFPQTNQRYFIVRIENPIGTSIEKTIALTEKIEKRLYQIPEIENFLTTIGSNESPAMSEGISANVNQKNSHIANITVNLTDKESREKTSYELANSLEEEFKNIKEAKVSISQISEGPPKDAAITAKISGKDLNELEKITLQVENIFKENSSTKNVESSLEQGLNEFKFTLNKDALAMHGLSAPQVATTIRSIIQGTKSTSVKLNNQDIDIIVKYNLPQKNSRTNLSFSDIENLKINSPKGYSLSLAEIASYEFTQSTNSISREDQKRVIKVTSGINEGFNSVETTKQLQSEIDKIKISEDYEISFGGDLESINESFMDLYKSMIIGVILIAFCIIMEFNSFRQTLIIMLTLPMALIGVFPGLMIIGLNLSFPAFLGVVALAGVVVNNAIVLIDRINENRQKGIELKASILEGARSRFEPVIMTTVTTIAGILPLAISNE